MMQVNPDGKVVPCCSMKYPTVLGDVMQEDIRDIWHGPAFNGFRRKLLRSRQEAGEVCGQCKLYRYDLHEEDIIDGVAKQLMDKYS